MIKKIIDKYIENKNKLIDNKILTNYLEKLKNKASNLINNDTKITSSNDNNNNSNANLFNSKKREYIEIIDLLQNNIKKIMILLIKSLKMMINIIN